MKQNPTGFRGKHPGALAPQDPNSQRGPVGWPRQSRMLTMLCSSLAAGPLMQWRCDALYKESGRLRHGMMGVPRFRGPVWCHPTHETKLLSRSWGKGNLMMVYFLCVHLHQPPISRGTEIHLIMRCREIRSGRYLGSRASSSR